MIKIVHEKEKCIGCGLCASICPEIFEISEDGRAHLKNSKKNEGGVELEIKESIPCINEAIDACPLKIIKLKRD